MNSAVLTKTQFIVQMVAAYARLYPEIETESAMSKAAVTFSEFIRDEKIFFGDKRYDWSSHGAYDLVYAYEGAKPPSGDMKSDGGEK
jgi:hypothetical protein